MELLDIIGLERLWSKIKTALSSKQDSLTFDSTPTDSSTNPVTSGGVKTALDLKANQSTTYTKTEVDGLFDDVAYLSDDDGTASTLTFDPQADTVWNKAQTLGSSQQAQARSNISAQETLVSGTNIKTINNESLLGSGNITISGGGSGDTNVIESISVNGTAQAVTDKNVDIAVPTKVSDLTNDSGFITSAPVTSVNGNTGAVTVNVPTALSSLTDDSTHRLVTDTEKSTWNGKQEALVSGTNIKTVNGESILGSGNISVSGGTGGDANVIESVKVNGTALSVTDKAVDITSVPASIVTQDATHRMVSDTEKSTWNNKSDFSGSYNDLTDTPTIPSAVTESTVSGWGFTKNTGNVSSTTITTIVSLTEAQYTALATKDSSTLYVIIES
mgnify:FL=1